ncbi:rab-GTPase-TBC domain-containing protein [Scheffersomyces amazonensis]|uniref:rab-GTPase-TBC domain-containing protein n=1 Tax=Scheffersomyces amazonensis TaxID=1078765 RepID=UPI00315CF8F8
MGKKKPEMSQVYSHSKNEFIFGENGGKGKHLSSFLKNLSLTSSSSSLQSSTNSNVSTNDYNDINSNIYGSLSYGNSKVGSTSSNPNGIIDNGHRIIPNQRSLSVGASFSHVNAATPPPPPPNERSNTSPYSHTHSHNTGSSLLLKGPRRSHSTTRYADNDDDWDAGLEEVSKNLKIVENKNLSRVANMSDSINLQPSPVLDSLYPDLMIPISSGSAPVRSRSNSPQYKGRTSKESLDDEDYQIKLEINRLNQLNTKYSKFRRILTSDNNINLNELRKISWNGIPNELRAISWQLLLGYLPTNKTRQSSTLKRKRQEYIEGIAGVITIDFENDNTNNNGTSGNISSNLGSNNSATSLANNNRDKQIYHQINIDVKRTHPNIKLYSYPEIQTSLRKILYLWAVRHPASGYVQGINDLVTPFFQIFLGNYLWQLQRTVFGENETKLEDLQLFIPGLLDSENKDEKEQSLINDPNLLHYTIDNIDPSLISSRVYSIIEADTYWCLSRLLENITDNYIHQQPGIIRQVSELKNLISKMDLELLNHLDNEGVEFIQFSFRWMNCLLMRELSVGLIIRMWDTYLSETPLGFNNFHVYVCAAFLIKFSNDLKERDFQEILLFLQNPPTTYWKEKDIELMLSEAFIWQSLYKNASAHLK